MVQRKRLYLDYAATSPVHPLVVAAMQQALEQAYGNPSSRHTMGLEAEQLLREARQVLARQLGTTTEQIIFTSGGTEANALALLGTARRQRAAGHVLVSALEHPSVRGTAQLLEQQGTVVEEIPASDRGAITVEAVTERLRPDTFLVAVMHVNNETGVRQPVEAIGRAIKARAPGCLFLVDAVQSFTHLPTRLGELGADLLSCSGHKIRGPKGSGCLALAPGVQLAPLWGGGEQERGRRPGTENVPGVVGLARAVELAAPEDEAQRRQALALARELTDRLPGAYVLGQADQRAAHILSLAVPGVPTEILVNLLAAEDVFVSSGAACHSRRSLRSHVLEAMGVPRDHGVIRLSWGSDSPPDDLTRAAELLVRGIRQLRGPRRCA